MDRIYFSNNKDLNLFFKDIKEDSKLSWKKIAESMNTTKSMLENYRKRRLSMPEDRFIKLLQMISNEDGKNYFLALIKRKDKNWGQIIGGKKAYKMNKKAFEKGRKK